MQLYGGNGTLNPYNNTIDYAEYGMSKVLYAIYVQNWSGMYSAALNCETNTYIFTMGWCTITKVSDTQIRYINTDGTRPNDVSALAIGVDSNGNTVVVGHYPR